MQKPTKHILVCGSMRTKGEPMGTCCRKGSLDLLQYLEMEIADRGLSDVTVSGTGCLKLCEKGPVMVVYPEGHWYSEVNEEAADEILEALNEGNAVEKYLIK